MFKVMVIISFRKSKYCFAGTYGNLQVLSVVTNGPYTHVLEF